MKSLLIFLVLAVPAAAEAPPELSAHQKDLLPEGIAAYLDQLNAGTLKAIASNLPIEERAPVGAAARSWRRLALPSIGRALTDYRRWQESLEHPPKGEQLQRMRGFLKADLFKELGNAPPPKAVEKKPDERPLQTQQEFAARPVPEVETAPTAPKPKPLWRRMWDAFERAAPD